MMKGVVGKFTDLGAAIWVVVIVAGDAAEGFAEGEGCRGGGGDDAVVGEGGELDGEGACCGAAAVDEDVRPFVLRLSVCALRGGQGWKSEFQGLVETLTDSRDADT